MLDLEVLFCFSHALVHAVSLPVYFLIVILVVVLSVGVR